MTHFFQGRQRVLPRVSASPLYGSPHALELPFVFRTLDAPLAMKRRDGPHPSAKLADIMNDAWIAFVKTGSPETPLLPQWPVYSMDKRATMILDVKCKVVNHPNSDFRVLYKGILY